MSSIFQLVWRNSKRIGAAWAIRKDKKLVVSIKYNPGGNYVGYFARNVFPPKAETLGPEWARLPPSWSRCPAKDVQTTLNTTVSTSTNMTKPNVKAAAGRVVSSLQLFMGSFLLAGLFL